MLAVTLTAAVVLGLLDADDDDEAATTGAEEEEDLETDEGDEAIEAPFGVQM